MNQASRDVVALIKKYGFVLKRKKKHLVFQHPSGAILVTSKTTSDHRTIQNVHNEIKRLLSL